jgi:hypothetical protein
MEMGRFGDSDRRMVVVCSEEILYDGNGEIEGYRDGDGNGGTERYKDGDENGNRGIKR